MRKLRKNPSLSSSPHLWGNDRAQNTVGSARPLAVVSDVNTLTPKLYFVHVDHLNRPIMMTDSTKTNVWAATWLPFGGAHAIAGTAANDNLFPGQRFQVETGLHYNWNRHYDPTTGRYTQADPLGLIDGPSVYAYAGSNPQNFVDPEGEQVAGRIGRGNNPGRVLVDYLKPKADFAMALARALQACLIPNVLQNEENKDKPPAGSRPINQTPWSGDHKAIKKGADIPNDGNTKIDPSGNVWGQQPDGTWTNKGPAKDYVGSGNPSGRRGKDRKGSRRR